MWRPELHKALPTTGEEVQVLHSCQQPVKKFLLILRVGYQTIMAPIVASFDIIITSTSTNITRCRLHIHIHMVKIHRLDTLELAS